MSLKTYNAVVYLVNKLSFLLAKRRGSDARSDPTSSKELVDMVDVINAMMLPNVWIFINEFCELSVTYLKRCDVQSTNVLAVPLELRHTCDNMWLFDPVAQTYTCMKSRNTHHKIGETVPALPAVQALVTKD